jgi:hypothetical protein
MKRHPALFAVQVSHILSDGYILSRIKQRNNLVQFPNEVRNTRFHRRLPGSRVI